MHMHICPSITSSLTNKSLNKIRYMHMHIYTYTCAILEESFLLLWLNNLKFILLCPYFFNNLRNHKIYSIKPSNFSSSNKTHARLNYLFGWIDTPTLCFLYLLTWRYKLWCVYIVTFFRHHHHWNSTFLTTKSTKKITKTIILSSQKHFDIKKYF
jgi:hypothetical protein